MAYEFEQLNLADESEFIPAGSGDYVLVGVELMFRDDESGARASVRAQVPVPGLAEGRDVDRVHEDAASRAEDLVRSAAQHLEDNDPQILARAAQGS
jgi:hypothetical protein